MRIMISACLCGINCKYSGGNNYSRILMDLCKDHEIMTVCPEVEGGLSIPRKPCEIVNGIVTNNEGTSCDDEFRKGAMICLEKAKQFKPDVVVLQSRSPSCGIDRIYDGSFSSQLTEGDGIFASLLKENGFNIIDIACVENKNIDLSSILGYNHN